MQTQEEQDPAAQWAALSRSDVPDEEDPDLQQAINEVCNRGVRLMLKDPRPVEMEDYRSEISELGAYFSNKGNMEGATFIYVLYQMTQHILVKQTETLGGIYKAAFLKIFDLLEDSGWVLKPEGKEGEPDENSVSPAPADSGLGSYGGQ